MNWKMLSMWVLLARLIGVFFSLARLFPLFLLFSLCFVVQFEMGLLLE